MEKPIKIDDLGGAPLFLETSKYTLETNKKMGFPNCISSSKVYGESDGICQVLAPSQDSSGK